MRSLKHWMRGLLTLPGVVLPLLPSTTCPVCIAAYAGALSTLGLGFLFNARVQTPLILAFLAVSVASIAWSTRSHRGLGPLVASLAGSAAVVTGRIIWTIPAVVYAGIALLMGASLWNLWLKRPRSKPLVQIEVMPREESNT